MQVQSIQRHLLQTIQKEHPDLMYPAALGCLADLTEVKSQFCVLVVAVLLNSNFAAGVAAAAAGDR